MVSAILKRGLPILIIHVDVDPKRTAAFVERSQKVRDLNGWGDGVTVVIDEPYRDLYQSVARSLKTMRDTHPDVYFQVYIGALRTRFPYNLLHMSTDRFLRDALLESDDVSLNIKQVNLDSLPLPEGFKVTFEHATDPHAADEAHIAVPAHQA